jgi:sugar phosphate isomerase/epimerase
VTLFTGQWQDVPFEELCRRAAAMGFDGLEVAGGGDHLDVRRAAEDPAYATARRDLAASHGLQIVAISNHLVGACACACMCACACVWSGRSLTLHARARCTHT